MHPGAQLAFDAVRADAWTIVERLLEGHAVAQGNAPQLVDENGNALLHVAAFCGASDSVHVLLRHGADPTALNAHEQSALDLAFLSGHHAIVQLLRTGGAASGTSLAGQTEATSDVFAQPELTLRALPLEMHVRILRCLDLADVLRCARVCRRFAKALDDHWLWESLCWSHFHCDSLQARRGLCTWKDVYKEQYVCHRAQARHREQRKAERAPHAERSGRRAEPDQFGSPRIVPTMASSLEELFEPLPM
ncbi:hypothetical protein KFE25_013383 [Diacronema lutheri]|uniref:F-box domain-containing protein n=1 Tax=Diacronema lutheri TaxID=2081491 RepID=A0A8J5XUR0_DIALT|nr:hypothetical protein KFE25_013383 [Diacronema lutheri]